MKNVLLTLSSGIAGAAVLALATAAPSQALGLSFNPGGSLLPDGDGIRDIVEAPGNAISFDIILDTLNLSAASDTVTSVSFDFGFDGLELINSSIAPAVGLSVNAATQPGGAFNLTYSGLSVAGNIGQTVLGTLNFTTSPNLPSDGARDFFTFLTAVEGNSPSGLTDFLASEAGAGNAVQISKQVEVQAVPTPALMPGLVGMGMAFARKRKKQSEAAA